MPKALCVSSTASPPASMNDMTDLITKDFEAFLDNLAKLLGENTEIVVHDFRGDLGSTIVKIINGHVSGRKIGDAPPRLFFDRFPDFRGDADDLELYFGDTDSGKTLKSSTTLLRAEDGTVIGAVCINMDISELMSAQKALQNFIGMDSNVSVHHKSFIQNVSDLLEAYLRDVETLIGKTGTEMSRQERTTALKYLDEHGAMQIAKSYVRLCEFFGISKFTLYSQLDEIRNGGGGEKE